MHKMLSEREAKSILSQARKPALPAADAVPCIALRVQYSTVQCAKIKAQRATVAALSLSGYHGPSWLGWATTGPSWLGWATTGLAGLPRAKLAWLGYHWLGWATTGPSWLGWLPLAWLATTGLAGYHWLGWATTGPSQLGWASRPSVFSFH